MNDFQEQCQIVFHATVVVGGYVFKQCMKNNSVFDR